MSTVLARVGKRRLCYNELFHTANPVDVQSFHIQFYERSGRSGHDRLVEPAGIYC